MVLRSPCAICRNSFLLSGSYSKCWCCSGKGMPQDCRKVFYKLHFGNFDAFCVQ